jgi:hypothetical protein
MARLIEVVEKGLDCDGSLVGAPSLTPYEIVCAWSAAARLAAMKMHLFTGRSMQLPVQIVRRRKQID